MNQFVHLHVHSCYSFLDGASDLEAIVRRAAELGMPAVTLTDRNSLAAAVKFRDLCQSFGVRPIYGAEITMQDGTPLTLLAQDRTGYANLCRLISLAFERGGRLTPALAWNGLTDYAEGLICLTGCRESLVSESLQAGRFGRARRVLDSLTRWFGKENVYVELIQDFTPGSQNRCRHLVELASSLNIGVVATNDVHYALREDYPVHDVLRCIGAGITLAEDKHEARPLNAEQYFKSASEMAVLFEWCPQAVAASLEVGDCCRCDLPTHEQITPVLSDLPDGFTSEQFLRELVFDGLPTYYPRSAPGVIERLEFELRVFADLGYTNFVLLAWDAAREAKARGIWFQLRGSAGCSLVLRCIGVSNVDPISRNLPFARFMAPGKVPDIDIDFAHDRRDEMLIYHREKYGARHVAMCCTFVTYWAKGAIRDIGKVLELPEDLLAILRKHVSGYVAADEIEAAFAKHPELQHHGALLERCQLLFALARRIAEFPRHLGTHSSGMVITREPIDTIAPTTPSARGILPIVTLDKDDIEAIGGIKLDMLCLRIMSAVADAVTSIKGRDRDFDYDSISVDVERDPEVLSVIQAGKAFGVFQLESPAQMNLALLLVPRLYEDLVASIALIRPGPISSGTVQKFISARNGYVKIDFLHPLLEPVLERTYGCVVFQEQVVHLIAVMTGWSEPQADAFRKRLTRHHRLGTMAEAEAEFITTARTHVPDLSERSARLLFQEVRGWAGLGFAESHAASFAIIAAKSASLSVHHPAEFFAGLLNHQPMGFWPSNSLVAEARRRGVLTGFVDINKSTDKCIVETEEGGEMRSIRLGFRVVDGIRAGDIAAILHTRGNGSEFKSLLDFCVRVPVAQDAIESLILCGAFDDLHYGHRRGLMWRLDETLALARSLREEAGDRVQMRLEMAQSYSTPIAWELDDLSPWSKLMWEWTITGICAASHPLAWMREHLSANGVLSVAEAERQPDGARVQVAGLNIRPHRPPNKRTGGRHLFTSIEDETDVLQAAFYGEEVIHRCTPVILLSPVIVATGTILRRGPGVSFEVSHVEPLNLTSILKKQEKGNERQLVDPPERSTSAR